MSYRHPFPSGLNVSGSWSPFAFALDGPAPGPPRRAGGVKEREKERDQEREKGEGGVFLMRCSVSRRERGNQRRPAGRSDSPLGFPAGLLDEFIPDG